MGGGNQGRAGRKNSRRNGNFRHARQSRFFAGAAFLRKHRMPPASRYAFAGRGRAAMLANARRFAKRRRRLFALAKNRPQPLVCIAGDNAAARLAAKSGDDVARPKPKASAARGNKIVGGGSSIKRTPLRNINPRPHPRPRRIPLAVANPATPPPPLPPRLGIGIPSIPSPNPNHRWGRLTKSFCNQNCKTLLSVNRRQFFSANEFSLQPPTMIFQIPNCRIPKKTFPMLQCFGKIFFRRQQSSALQILAGFGVDANFFADGDEGRHHHRDASFHCRRLVGRGRRCTLCLRLGVGDG